MSPNSSPNTFPTELIDAIFQNLDFQDLCIARQLNHRCCAIADHIAGLRIRKPILNYVGGCRCEIDSGERSHTYGNQFIPDIFVKSSGCYQPTSRFGKCEPYTYCFVGYISRYVSVKRWKSIKGFERSAWTRLPNFDVPYNWINKELEFQKCLLELEFRFEIEGLPYGIKNICMSYGVSEKSERVGRTTIQEDILHYKQEMTLKSLHADSSWKACPWSWIHNAHIRDNITLDVKYTMRVGHYDLIEATFVDSNTNEIVFHPLLLQ
jgi:hypothetical protein